MTRRVVLLHGLWMPGLSMAWHARQLRKAGFDPHVFAYRAVSDGPQAVVAALLEHLREPADILGHSLGGLLALRALQQNPQLPVRRLVCLGSPLCGSAAATGLARRLLPAAALGRAAGLLHQGCTPWQGRAHIGAIAGNVRFGLGRLFSGDGGEGDGTVAVAETRLPGLNDHVLVPASHSGLLVSAQASQQAIAFLRHGAFVH